MAQHPEQNQQLRKVEDQKVCQEVDDILVTSQEYLGSTVVRVQEATVSSIAVLFTGRSQTLKTSVFHTYNESLRPFWFFQTLCVFLYMYS